ncbi:MAG: MGMT family protein [Candidatus Thorarchaeota archaeon]
MYKLTQADEEKLAKLSTYQQAILRILAEVPKGKVTTASRAVGTTMKNNPCAPQVPCHRVIKSDGNIGNFRGGAEGAVEEKIKMLLDEGVEVVDGKIDLKKFRHLFK